MAFSFPKRPFDEQDKLDKSPLSELAGPPSEKVTRCESSQSNAFDDEKRHKQTKVCEDWESESDGYQSENEIKDFSKVNIPETLNCHTMNKESCRQTLDILGAKRFLVNHDYIVFPYCIENSDGSLERPSTTRVSHILHRLQAFNPHVKQTYDLVKKRITVFDEILDCDSTNGKALEELTSRVLNADTSEMDETSMYFLGTLLRALIAVTSGQDINASQTHNYRGVFADFLRIIAVTKKHFTVLEKPEAKQHNLEFPQLGKTSTVSAHPDIVISYIDPARANSFASDVGNAIVIECKSPPPKKEIPEFKDVPELSSEDDRDVKPVKPKVKIGGVLTIPVFSSTGDGGGPACDGSRSRKVLYKDTDCKICRHLKQEEKRYLEVIIAQNVCGALVWLDTKYSESLLRGNGVPACTLEKKSIRYAISLIGFHVIFVTIGITSNDTGRAPHLSIGDSKGMGVDVFITRPFDLMKAKDRAIITNTLFALMH